MLKGIPEQVINDIQDRCDIVEIISGYIPLKRAGKNFRANCPFHHEKSPSFMVSPDKQIYHCFGCGVGGNVFNFLMRYDRLEFPEAVEILAKKVGVVLPKADNRTAEDESLGQKIYKINELASEFYHQYILNSSEAQSAREYLAGRKIDIETIKKFKLGFSPNKWDALLVHLRNKNISIGLIDKAGLCVTREDKGGYYDRFRNRIIFPISDARSRIVGFGARVMGDALPKYMNSPETAVYSKGKNIFGLNLTKDAIRSKDFVIIVEGYLDFITPFQSGVDNIVASLGTALTLEQIRLLKRYTHNVVTLFDSDQAGQMATLRSLDLFLEEDMNVKVVDLPEGYDPDSFIQRRGPEEFKQLILDAKNLIDYKLNVLMCKYDVKAIEGKADIVREMLPTIGRFKNAVLKFSYLKKIAESLMLKEESLLIELGRLKETGINRVAEAGPQAVNNFRLRPTEKMILKLVLEEKDFLVYAQDALELQDFQDERVRDIMSFLFDMVSRGEEVSPSKLINLYEDGIVTDFISSLSMSEDAQSLDKEKMFQDCIRRLKQDRVKLRCQQLCTQIKNAEDCGDKDKIHELIKDYNAIIKKGV